MDRNELKIQAIKERVGQIVANYEEQIADFRADATMQITELQQENERLKNALEEKESEVTSHTTD